MKTENIPGGVEAGGSNEHKPNLKEKALHELREFFGMTIYLWLLFALFALHDTIILTENHLNYQAQGLAIVNALLLAKVMLIGEDLHLGNRFKDNPLVYSILYKAFTFSVVFIGFHIVENVLVGVLRGRTIVQSFPAIGGGSLKGIVSVGTIMFVSLIPFFAFREVGRVIGKSELWSLLFTRGTRVYTLHSRQERSEEG
jgi:hypothetical protein